MTFLVSNRAKVLGATAVLAIGGGMVAGSVSAAPLPPEPLPQMVSSEDRVDLFRGLNRELKQQALATGSSPEGNAEAAELAGKRQFQEFADIQSWDAWPDGQDDQNAGSNPSATVEDVADALNQSTAPSSGGELSGAQQEQLQELSLAAAADLLAEAAGSADKRAVDGDLSDFNDAKKESALRDALGE